MNMDIKNYYLGTLLERYEYVRIPVSMVVDKIMDENNLHAMVHNGYLYVEVRKGMYGLPQAGLLANVLLEKRLAKHGYSPVPHTHGIWTHKWRPIKFSLFVDDFGVMYVGREHDEHLKAALEENYEISTDWEGGNAVLRHQVNLGLYSPNRGPFHAGLHRRRLTQISAPTSLPPPACPIQDAAYQLWRKSAICNASGYSHSLNRRIKTHLAAGYRVLTLLR
jgi:hypothetical protein